jgi:hypothetical protein
MKVCKVGVKEFVSKSLKIILARVSLLHRRQNVSVLFDGAARKPYQIEQAIHSDDKSYQQNRVINYRRKP